jgi:hypothetical protein
MHGPWHQMEDYVVPEFPEAQEISGSKWITQYHILGQEWGRGGIESLFAFNIQTPGGRQIKQIAD